MTAKEYDTLFADAFGCVIVGFGVHRTVGAVRIHHGAEHQAEHAAYFVVQFLGTHFPFADALQIGVGQVVEVICVARMSGQSVRSRPEFQVESMGDGLVRIVRASPIGDDYSVKSPFTFQNVVYQVLVVAPMLSFIQVVRPHDSPCASFLDGGLECWQVDFIQGAVVHDDIGVVSVYFVVVQRIVLDAGSHSIALHAFYVRHYHLGGQVRIFAHVFEVASVERRAVDVDARSQYDVFLAVACFLADAFAVE